MKKAKDNKKSPSTVFSGIWGTILMMLLITVAFGILIYGMYITDFISVIDFSAVIANNNRDDNRVNNDLVYETLRDAADSYQFVYASTPEELTDIIADLSLPYNFNMKATVSTLGADGFESVDIAATHSLETYVIDKSRDGTVFEKIELSSNGYVTVTDVARNSSAKHKNSKEITFESQCGIPSLNDVSDLCESILDGSVDVSEHSVSLVSKDNVSYYCVTVTYDDINQRDEYYLSTNSSLIEEAYTYVNDTIVYAYRLNEFVA